MGYGDIWKNKILVRNKELDFVETRLSWEISVFAEEEESWVIKTWLQVNVNV